MNLIDMIKLNEGHVMEDGRHVLYRDNAEPPKQTIAYGRNLTDRGLSESEAETLLWNDVERVTAELNLSLSYFCDLSENRRYALIDMCFNLGFTRFMGFKKMLTALERKDYETAAEEALDSRWSRQVGARSFRDAKMIREG